MPVVDYTVVNGELLSENRAGVKRDYVADSLGSTVALLDSTQTKTDTFTYWPYGEVKTRTGTTATPFQFVGTLGYYRDSTSRDYVRARYLRKDLTRWQTEDPLWPTEPDYGYARQNPTLLTDMSGLSCVAQPNQAGGPSECEAEYKKCSRQADRQAVGKITACTGASIVAARACSFILVPHLRVACYLAVATGYALCTYKARIDRDGALADCLRTKEDCLRRHGESTFEMGSKNPYSNR